MNRIVLAVVALLSVSCVPTPPYYSVPPQHTPPGPAEVVVFGEYVLANAPNADTYLVKDVKGLEGATWRWTLAEPEFRFRLGSAVGRIFRLDFGVNDVTFRETGPLKLVIRVNGNVLDQPTFDKPGDARYEHRVPQAFLKENAENRVAIQVVNPWQAPDPGVRLGFLLHGAGFVSK